MSDRMKMIQEAVRIQAEDETLWHFNMPGEPFQVSIGEAYVQQSLRWLHKVIEEGDEQALQAIINQNNGDV